MIDTTFKTIVIHNERDELYVIHTNNNTLSEEQIKTLYNIEPKIVHISYNNNIEIYNNKQLVIPNTILVNNNILISFSEIILVTNIDKLNPNKYIEDKVKKCKNKCIALSNYVYWDYFLKFINYKDDKFLNIELGLNKINHFISFLNKFKRAYLNNSDIEISSFFNILERWRKINLTSANKKYKFSKPLELIGNNGIKLSITYYSDTRIVMDLHTPWRHQQLCNIIYENRETFLHNDTVKNIFYFLYYSKDLEIFEQILITDILREV
jgi:hypothetical protein